MRLHIIATFILGAFFSTTVDAATFELARRPDGLGTLGLKIEGEIIPGDTSKLLGLYKSYGQFISPIYLRSRGGDVEEAMRMGAAIRRLRLETEAPTATGSAPPVSLVKSTDKENMICGSACFLVYVAGIRREGNYVALHRPFLTKAVARNLSDLDYEQAQKQEVSKVQLYLREMEVDQYWIDRLLSTSSQDAYIPTSSEANSKLRHLMGTAPAIEEVLLAKCSEDRKVTDQISALQTIGRPLNSEEMSKLKSLLEETSVYSECKSTVLNDIRSAAFARENDRLVQERCMPPNSLPLNQCKAKELYALQFETYKKWTDATEKLRSTASAGPAGAFEAKVISADEALKSGLSASGAKDYGSAMGWFNRAAELGNAEAMREISKLYAGGRGVSQNDAEAARWRQKAADQGDLIAMSLVGHDFEQGRDAPQDYGAAMKWYKKAADLGGAYAMTSIGFLYFQGHGVTQDYAEAMRWYEKAAELGDENAMLYIGLLYASGAGVPKDEERARGWMKKAAAKGVVPANMWLIDHPQ